VSGEVGSTAGGEPVSERPGGPRAADVFAAELAPRPGGRLRHAARIAGAFAAELAWQLLPSPSVHDVVVTRRDDGSEVVRLPAGQPLLAGESLARIRADLGRLDSESFVTEWTTEAPPDR
jgi:hypothetical protein